jgi:hypothetical protein
MKKSLAGKLLLWSSTLVHPILFAVFPVIFLYAHNMGEASASQILKPVLLLSTGALMLWLLLSLLLRNTLKAGLATTIFVILFSSYGRIYDLLVDWDSSLSGHAYLFPATLLVWGYCTYFISILKIDLRRATKVVNIVAVVLVMVNVASIAVHDVGKHRLPSGGSLVTQGVAAAEVDPDSMPDIYYIILDEYAHPDTMLDYYDYDCSGFIDGLVDRGFYVASGSRVRYSESFRSISSSLNMDYVSDAESMESCYERIADSAVANYLRSTGYMYLYFGSWYDAGRYKVNADVSYNFYESSGSDMVTDFSRTLWNTTMARPFYDHLTASVSEEYYRSGLIGTIESLKTVPDVEGPKFVFAHIMCPHEPFVFGPNGEHIDRTYWNNTRDVQFYLGQYMFISNQIAGVVATILERSSSDPIIIVQSDHGTRPGVSGCVGMTGEEWPKVLNAYHLPGEGSDDLCDSISPVNSFRVIFNQYFGMDYELLED